MLLAPACSGLRAVPWLLGSCSEEVHVSRLSCASGSVHVLMPTLSVHLLCHEQFGNGVEGTGRVASCKTHTLGHRMLKHHCATGLPKQCIRSQQAASSACERPHSTCAPLASLQHPTAPAAA